MPIFISKTQPFHKLKICHYRQKHQQFQNSSYSKESPEEHRCGHIILSAQTRGTVCPRLRSSEETLRGQNTKP